MGFLEHFKWFRKSSYLIHLDGEFQEDGYLYIHSDDLKGFNLLLEPEQCREFGSLVKAIEDPLLAYADAYFAAKRTASAKAEAKAVQEKSRYEFVDFSRKSKTSFSAVLGTCLNHCG
ncbi:hypothetical protein [Methylocystis sp. SB2]|uniref:hypothetical protein n=1 Tax=Methylocystis sp. (strain SB2) TaxID=743836 RepID=UPI0004A4C501|nr:hypothetical protein [Methylocystis sp. SB2]ULO25125.1 hypothetical protein LNB28_06975 [Methylocystis sp. SB2]